MRLYHGTSGAMVERILKEGIKPRGSRAGNWKHTVESNPRCAYLTSAYAGYFAHSATKRGTRLGILEVETGLLDERDLLPDEDFLEQCSRGQKWDNKIIQRALRGKGMKQRTTWFRDNAFLFQSLWEKSIEHMGTCCYHGVITPRAITHAVIFDWNKNTHFGMRLIDPTITPMNYKLCGDGYKALTKWLMDEPITLEDLLTPVPIEFYTPEQRAELQADIDNRSGIEVLK